jgi:hypothetical protein
MEIKMSVEDAVQKFAHDFVSYERKHIQIKKTGWRYRGFFYRNFPSFLDSLRVCGYPRKLLGVNFDPNYHPNWILFYNCVRTKLIGDADSQKTSEAIRNFALQFVAEFYSEITISRRTNCWRFRQAHFRSWETFLTLLTIVKPEITTNWELSSATWKFFYSEVKSIFTEKGANFES